MGFGKQVRTMATSKKQSAQNLVKVEPPKDENKVGTAAVGYVRVPLHQIEADNVWNARSGEFTEDGEDAEGGSGFEGLVTSIRDDGQTTPGVGRHHPDKSKAKKTPVSLVSGFRRYWALVKILRQRDASFADKSLDVIAKQLGDNMPTMLLEVKDMTEAQARLENIRENTARAALKPSDTVFAVMNLKKLGLSDSAMVGSLNKSQEYISKFSRIIAGFDGTNVLQEWRERKATPLSVEEMHAIATDANAKGIARTPAERATEYAERAANRVEKRGGGKKGKVETMCTSAQGVGVKLGLLVRAGAIELGGTPAELVRALFDVPEDFDADQRRQVFNAMTEGIKKGQEEPKVKDATNAKDAKKALAAN